MTSTDVNGVEALKGESEAEYVARQTRLREEAAARMRAKFGASGGLGGGVCMGGVGSAPASSGGYSSGELLSSLGGGLTSAASGVASAASTASWVGMSLLSSAKESAKSYVASRGSGGATSDMPEEPLPTDLSDLLGHGGGHEQIDAPPPRASPFTEATRTPSSTSIASASAPAAPPPVGDDFFNDKVWGAAPSTSMPSAATLMPAAAAPPPSVHYSGGGGVTPTRRKVAAVKVKSNDAGWDDWGDAGKW